MRIDQTGRRRLTDSDAKDAYAAWAPDVRSLYFVRFEADGSKVMRVGLKNGRCGR